MYFCEMAYISLIRCFILLVLYSNACFTLVVQK